MNEAASGEGPRPHRMRLFLLDPRAALGYRLRVAPRLAQHMQ
jgi:hypothetical protein